MTLDRIKRGQRCRILSLPSESIRAQALRFGIAEGEIVTCSEVIPGGPVIISKNHQEIAIGRGLARQIEVEGSI
ncbi:MULTISPECIES: FeoA family protein [Desulfofundulus]|jgi:Fe2+ transport system protein FeoA|uniref:Fe2+ transport system protein FeoA n=1 Tax=Desulfofundulus australicus DSM 11792 TaxID=1121425 RepID=A0A1M5B2X9_9FIRM|nr:MULTISPECIES: ferrous iron transport protein A [Desulfofundulus]MBE3585775.1 ferrous iron transport protein A [Thermoanaerobacter sp.]MCS5696362.1 ferrous iron transport protein A [Desulfofundulus thermocisternus]SHF36864.1 Fe2+ transport system protein FeoA [Desulfofundulus australicus DSM 11792]